MWAIAAKKAIISIATTTNVRGKLFVMNANITLERIIAANIEPNIVTSKITLTMI